MSAANGFGPDGWRARQYPQLPSGAQYYAYTFDPQGSLVDRAYQGGSGAGYDRSVYTAWGQTLAQVLASTGAPSPARQPVGLGGQWGYYRDADPSAGYDTGLLLLTARYYDPGTGRFLTRDPLGYAGGQNLYGFAGNDPVNEIDPSGLAPEGGERGLVSEEAAEWEETAVEFGEWEREAFLARGNEPIIREFRFPEWRPGAPIDMLTPEGKYPEFYARPAPAKPYTIQGRYWMNRATFATPNEFDPQQFRSMRAGFAPTARVLVRLPNGTYRAEKATKELHHALRNRGVPGFVSPRTLYEVWPWEHALIDPHRKTGYEFIKFLEDKE